MQDQNTMAVSIERLNLYINLERYPIHEPDSRAGQALIAQAHETRALAGILIPTTGLPLFWVR